MAQAVMQQQLVFLNFVKPYQEFLNDLRQHKHPLNDSLKNTSEVFNRFMELFAKAPEYLKPELASTPLFSQDAKFAKYEESRESTRPLNYIMLTANLKALDAIEKYLKPEDWSRCGSYDSPLMHCIITGIEKHSVYAGGKPIECAQRLFKNYPQAKTKPCRINQSPQEYLKIVLRELEKKLAHIQNHGTPGYHGLFKTYTWEDGTTETDTAYDQAVSATYQLSGLIE